MRQKKLITTPWGPAHKTNQIATGLFDWWAPAGRDKGQSGWWVSAKRLTQMPDFTHIGTVDPDPELGACGPIAGMWFFGSRWILPCLAFLPEVKAAGPEWWPAYKRLIEQILGAYDSGMPVMWVTPLIQSWCLSKLEKDK